MKGKDSWGKREGRVGKLALRWKGHTSNWPHKRVPFIESSNGRIQIRLETWDASGREVVTDSLHFVTSSKNTIWGTSLSLYHFLCIKIFFNYFGKWKKFYEPVNREVKSKFPLFCKMHVAMLLQSRSLFQVDDSRHGFKHSVWRGVGQLVCTNFERADKRGSIAILSPSVF